MQFFFIGIVADVKRKYAKDNIFTLETGYDIFLKIQIGHMYLFIFIPRNLFYFYPASNLYQLQVFMSMVHSTRYYGNHISFNTY